MPDKWIKGEIIRANLPEFTNGAVDQEGLIQKSLDDLEEYEAEHEDFLRGAAWMKMRVLVKNVINASRKSRKRREKEEEGGGQTTMLDLPGWEEIEHDTVVIGTETIPTPNLDAEQLAEVVLGWRRMIAGYEQAMMHYIALRQHLVARGAERVRDLYRAA